MRFLSLGLGLVSLLPLSLGLAMGCTAQGSDESATEPSPVEPTPSTPARTDPTPLPPTAGEMTSSGANSGGGASSSSSGTNSSSGSVPVDAGSDGNSKPDAATGPTTPAPGDACATAGVLFERTCGFCGKQEAVCEADNTVSSYGFCRGEVAGGCAPGAIEDVPCGRCGTRKQVCQANCAAAVGACVEPAGACWPNAVKWTSAGCAAPDTFRKQVCTDMCTFGSPSPPPCGPKDAWASIAGPGGQVEVDGALSPTTDVVGRLDVGTCPPSISTLKTSYAFTEIKNTFAKGATVEIRYDNSVGSIDTVTAAYAGTKRPDVTKDAERKACVGKVNDVCSDSSAPSWSCLVGADAVKIPAGGTAWIYTANWYGSATGPFRLVAKTTAMDP